LWGEQVEYVDVEGKKSGEADWKGSSSEEERNQRVATTGRGTYTHLLSPGVKKSAHGREDERGGGKIRTEGKSRRKKRV